MSDMNVKSDLFTHPFCCYSIMLVVTIGQRDGRVAYASVGTAVSTFALLTVCILSKIII
jgi:hypothetical protein